MRSDGREIWHRSSRDQGRGGGGVGVRTENLLDVRVGAPGECYVDVNVNVLVSSLYM